MDVGFSISLFHIKFRKYMNYEKTPVSQDVFACYVNFLTESLWKLKIEFFYFIQNAQNKDIVLNVKDDLKIILTF